MRQLKSLAMIIGSVEGREESELGRFAVTTRFGHRGLRIRKSRKL
ncbi:MAG TPA: hypothetical protein VIN35_15110 [Hydrogenophaga sp.]